MTDPELTELCHRVMREDASSVLLVRGYAAGILQLTDAAKKLRPDVDTDLLREALYRHCLPGFWAGDKIQEMTRLNPNITGSEMATILRQAAFDQCEHGRSSSGSCIACDEVPGMDITEETIQEALDLRFGRQNNVAPVLVGLTEDKMCISLNLFDGDIQLQLTPEEAKALSYKLASLLDLKFGIR